MSDTSNAQVSAPVWLRIARWPIRVRVGIIVGLNLLYVVAFLFAGAEFGRGTRPLNLAIVALAGLFFGLRGGTLVALGTVVLNVGLYSHAGIFSDTPGNLSGNVLSIIAGVAAAAGVGRMRDLSLELREQIARRVEAERRKNELTALLVHDLKNPLTAISGHAQLILEEERERGGENVESLQYIRAASERLNRMVLNLLDIGRAEEGTLIPRYETLELPRLLEEVQGAVHPQLTERELQLVVVQRHDDGRVQADADLLRRILINLLENAIKYTPRRRTVRLELAGTESDVELAVRDEGPGIPSGYEERIFDKYMRLERDVSTAADASRGLGLHFCKLAAAAHGGRIWVEPNSPQGSVFRVRLPRAGTRVEKV